MHKFSTTRWSVDIARGLQHGTRRGYHDFVGVPVARYIHGDGNNNRNN